MSNTPNIGLTIPANGADVGNWDSQAMNPNLTEIDLCFGGIATISLNNSNVVLNSGQLQSRMLIFNSTLTGSVTITFAASFVKDYVIWHQCTGSSAFTITLETTATGQIICAVPGEQVQVFSDGTNLNYMNFGRIGEYWDYGGSSVPNWVQGCSPKQPYLNCDGTTFSSATYPTLALVYGSTTLPNSKGRARIALDQGAGNISSGTGGFSGAGVGATGGGMTTTLGTSNLPAYTPSGSVTVFNGTNLATPNPTGNAAAGGQVPGADAAGTVTASFTGTAQGGVSQAFTNLPPAFIGGLMMVRAG